MTQQNFTTVLALNLKPFSWGVSVHYLYADIRTDRRLDQTMTISISVFKTTNASEKQKIHVVVGRKYFLILTMRLCICNH